MIQGMIPAGAVGPGYSFSRGVPASLALCALHRSWHLGVVVLYNYFCSGSLSLNILLTFYSAGDNPDQGFPAHLLPCDLSCNLSL